MKSKDWKNLWFYGILASGSTIWCSINMEVVKATDAKKQAKQEESVLKISSLGNSRLISKLSEQFSSSHNRAKVDSNGKRKKNTSLNLQPDISQTNRFDIKAQVLGKNKGNIPILQKDQFSGSKMLPMVSQPLGNVIISQPLGNTIVFQSIEDSNVFKPVENRNVFKPVEDKNVFKPVQQIAQNQEPSTTPSIPAEPQEDSPTVPSTPAEPEEDSPQAPSAPEKIETDPPPLESQPTDFPASTPSEIEQKLDSLEDERSKRLKRLLELLQKNQEEQEQSLNRELGIIRVREVPIQLPPKKTEPPSIEKPVAKFKPIGYLLGRAGYFYTSNIFSSRTDAIDDGLIFSGLTLATAPFKIGPKTYLNGSIDGNIIRYGDQSEFNYNQIRFNLGIYQQLTRKMYSEIGWNNQQLFYSQNNDRFNFASGDKFLNENSFRLSVGRRDLLGPKLNLDSFYQFRLSLTNPPEKRNRIINYLWLSLNYSLQQSLRVGIDYQFNLSNFLERNREDQYHRLSGNLKYRISDLSSVNLQSGFTLGGSTDRNLDFDGWFFSVNYSWDLGQF